MTAHEEPRFEIGPEDAHLLQHFTEFAEEACGLAFYAGMLESALEQIAEAGNACHCDRGFPGGCGCGEKMGEAAEEALGLYGWRAPWLAQKETP